MKASVMRRFVLAGVIGLGLATQSLGAAPTDQASLEKAFDAAIHPDELGGWLKIMASEPNHVGSPHDKANAEYQLGLFKSWGWDAHIETFDVLYPTPISQTVELAGAHPFKATLVEPPIPGDAPTFMTKQELPAYAVYGGDGDVTGNLVYVNFGTQEDYKALDRMGISVKGKIVIARYGLIWRGLKPKLAQDHGALGCIIYSDPADDGYALGDIYPNGPMRPPHGVQRGSVMDMPIYAGDPLTPGIGATKDAKRLSLADAQTLLKIPVVPISYADAQVFLQAMKGPVAPAGWRGALPITYHVGPGPAVAHLAVKSDWSLKTIYDVIATMKGSTWPDQWVIRGNHHDGWVFGATDPLAAQVALMGEAKAMGALAAQGWRPKRTIVYASWDAEEPMELGSTEWAEQHADELKKKAVLYVNSDTNGRGFFHGSGSHDFQHIVNLVAADVIDPETGVPVGDRLRARLAAAAPESTTNPHAQGNTVRAPAQAGRDFAISALGAGSDYSPFLQHLGIATLDLGYGGEGNSQGVYHSAYDTYEHHSRFVDPGFVYDALMAKTIGRLIMRVADSDLPLQRPSDLADTVSGYLDDVKRLADAMRTDAETQARLVQAHAYQLASDPTKPTLAPDPLARVPYFEFAPMDNAVDRMKRSARAYEEALARKGPGLSPDKLARLQGLMLDIDETLAPDVGLPGRPWYKSLIYAPGRYTGYAVKTLPGVREAIEQERWPDVDRYIKLTADALVAYSDRLDKATAVLNGA